MIEAAACISICRLNEVIVHPLDSGSEPGFHSVQSSASSEVMPYTYRIHVRGKQGECISLGRISGSNCLSYCK